MNGYDEKRHLDDAFGAKGGIVSAFDAFPKSKPQYITHTSSGGKWTIAMALISLVLFWTELARWWRGAEEHTFAVEKGVAHILPINLDVVIHMRCADLHVNVQDAAGDRILAAERLTRDPTSWAQWVDGKGVHRLGRDEHGKVVTGEGYDEDEGFGEEHVHDIVALGRRRAKWSKTPRLWGAEADSCRVYGSLELNKVQGDFHITARGHGYMEFGEHLGHEAFNFSHIISELSFGPFLPSLVNPLDRTVNTAPGHFHRFQYFLSVVPTIYSVGQPGTFGSSSILTNQYAVTEQSQAIAENMIPGIFVKYDIEPMLLNVVETRDSLIVFFIKAINIVSGVLVAGHWGYRLTDWLAEVRGKRRRVQSEGMLGAKGHFAD
ncbi:endoplasmic reticulum vesicle transporter-domain-containing protein [Staphylotrichum tortipilum]|uniref:Endoplasmic reticulum-Golgi intermediate compartment protein n=1 Tax=Staphylotrichum tortipilum TaxID=2831512 RepID=A0AAN6MD22_9PEZI|nr:endoplasmic reticulum vesicle transporter-domain-containing protein [Staphylotrichum longicolle]